MKEPKKNETGAIKVSCSWFLAILLSQIYGAFLHIDADSVSMCEAAAVLMLGYYHRISIIFVCD